MYGADGRKFSMTCTYRYGLSLYHHLSYLVTVRWRWDAQNGYKAGLHITALRLLFLPLT